VTIDNVEQAQAMQGQTLGPTEWLTITQDMVDRFAELTGDRQWIHVNPERARGGPFGACVAHGHLTLSLAGGRFFHELVQTTATSGVNYGLERVRFPAPVRVGRRVRATGLVQEVSAPKPGEVQLLLRLSVEIEGEAKPGCVADFLARYRF
jgi:acyl dehydratase